MVQRCTARMVRREIHLALVHLPNDLGRIVRQYAISAGKLLEEYVITERIACLASIGLTNDLSRIVRQYAAFDSTEILEEYITTRPNHDHSYLIHHGRNMGINLDYIPWNRRYPSLAVAVLGTYDCEHVDNVYEREDLIGDLQDRDIADLVQVMKAIIDRVSAADIS